MPTVEQLPLDLGDEIAFLMRKFYPVLVSQAYEDAGTVIGMDIAFDLDMPEVQEVLGDLALLIRDVTETTRDEIRALIGKQADEGWSLDQLADAILERGEIASKTRATLIARTESATAYSRGALLAYETSGVVSGTEWLLGPEPCPVCQPLGGKIAKLGKEFASGIAHPPAHPDCTCAIAPVLKGA